LGDAGNAGAEETLLGLLGAGGEASHILSVNPSVSLFMMKWALPMEFKFQYNIPVWGMNDNAQHATAFQIRAYFKF